MHEMSLVQGLFRQLETLARENGASRILTVTMEIGPLSGVVLDSFQFGFTALAGESELLKGARLIIEVVPVNYRCTGCNHSFSSQDQERPLACPECDDPFLIPSGGDDMILRQIEMV